MGTRELGGEVGVDSTWGEELRRAAGLLQRLIRERVHPGHSGPRGRAVRSDYPGPNPGPSHPPTVRSRMGFNPQFPHL